MPEPTGAPPGTERTDAPTEMLTRSESKLSSFNAEARTVDIVLATETPVRRRQWDVGVFDEILAVNRSSIDTSRLETMALLDAHDSYSGIESRLGSVLPNTLRFDGQTAIVTVKISRNDKGQALHRDLTDGHVLAASVGYRIIEQTRTEPPAGGTATVRATRWLPMEISIVSVPADPNASTRSLEGNHMPELNPGASTTVAAITTPASQTRGQANAEIRSIARAAGLDTAWADQQIDAEAGLDAVRAAAIAALQDRTASTAATVRTTHNATTIDNPDVRVRAAGEALFGRHNPGHQYTEQARQFVGMGTVDLARSALTNAGVSHAGMSVSGIIERALHSTSDFPLILGDSVGRTMRAAYTAAPSGLKRIARQTTAKDFKAKYKLQLSEAAQLEKVNESGEFKSGSLTEAKESYAIATYGKIFGITRQALVNDDLGAFNDLARRLGQAAAATEAKLMVDLWLANSGNGPTMADTVALFNLSSHKNLQTAAAFDIAPLSIMRTAMRRQVGLTGELISVEPKFLIIPPELETTAEQKLRTALYPASSSASTPDSFKQLEIVVEPRLTSATGYYLAADPASIDGLEFSYLEGEQGLQIETKAGFEVDGVQVKARVDFGAGAIDWRAFQKNAGA